MTDDLLWSIKVYQTKHGSNRTTVDHVNEYKVEFLMHLWNGETKPYEIDEERGKEIILNFFNLPWKRDVDYFSTGIEYIMQVDYQKNEFLVGTRRGATD